MKDKKSEYLSISLNRFLQYIITFDDMLVKHEIKLEVFLEKLLLKIQCFSNFISDEKS